MRPTRATMPWFGAWATSRTRWSSCLDQATRDRAVHVPGAGATTWWQVQQEHFAGFTAGEAAAVVAYLRWRSAGDEPEFARRSVKEALDNYWLARADPNLTGDKW